MDHRFLLNIFKKCLHSIQIDCALQTALPKLKGVLKDSAQSM